MAIAIIVSNEVWNQFASKATSFKEFEMETKESESPAIIVEFWPLKKMDYPANVPYQSYKQWKLGEDFNLTFGVTEYKTVKEQVIFNQTHKSSNISHGSVGKVVLRNMMSKYGNVFKISANILHLKAPLDAFIEIEFNKMIQNETIPRVLIQLMSEVNSFGISMYNFMDGAILSYDNVKGFIMVRIQPSKIIKLKSKAKCQEFMYYECFESKLLTQNYSQCPRKCVSISTPSEIMPLCKTIDEFKCSYEIAKRIQNDNSKNKCLPSCNLINFYERAKYDDDQHENRKVTFAYRFKDAMMKVEEEYLIQDFVGMLSSIGGTLGLFVGFSFVGLSSFVLEHLQRMLERLVDDKKSLSEVGNMQKGLIKVQNINDTAVMDNKVMLVK